MVKITPRNYNQFSRSIPFSRMPKDLADTHGEMPMYLEFYGQDKEITEVVDLYLNKVNQIINKPAACKPTIRTVYKDRVVPKIIYKDRIVEKIIKEPCKEVPLMEEKSFTEKLKNPLVIGGAIAGLILGKIL
jgi:hypothetical protein